jgi:hypothetical protein
VRLHVLAGDYAIFRLPAQAPIPPWALDGPFVSLTRTEHELSLVVREANAPPGFAGEGGWALLQVAGPLDFALTGVLASLTAPLAAAGISLFAISTFDTDYLLVKRTALAGACAALRVAGHEIA